MTRGLLGETTGIRHVELWNFRCRITNNIMINYLISARSPLSAYGASCLCFCFFLATIGAIRNSEYCK